MSARLVVRNVSSIKKVFDVLKDFAIEVSIQWRPSGALIAVADRTKSTLAIVEFGGPDYEFAGTPLVTGLNLSHFNRIMRTLRNTDTVTLTASATHVEIGAVSEHARREHAVRTIAVPVTDIVPTTPAVGGATRMKFAEFAAVVKELQSTGSSVGRIEIRDGCIVFAADGDLTRAHVALSDCKSRISKADAPVTNTYPIPFLFMFSKACRFSHIVSLHILVSGPLKLECDIPELGTFVYYITPLHSI